MRYGVFLPSFNAEPIDRATFRAWCRGVDEGPFASLCYGERTAWNTLDHFVALAAAATVTERVELWSYVLNLPMHPAQFAAKRAASIDVLSGGRYTMVVGVGGANRFQDWRSAEKPPLRFPHATMDRQITEMRAVWAGRPPLRDDDPIGPLLAGSGPRIMCSALGPKGLARAARWADGYAGYVGPGSTTPDGREADLRADAARVREAWVQAGRAEGPDLTTSSFFALGPDAKERLQRVTERYMNITVPEAGGEVYWVHGDTALRSFIDNARAASFDHVILLPTTYDVSELERLAVVVADAERAASDERRVAERSISEEP